MGSLFDFYCKRLKLYASEGARAVEKIWGWEIWLANQESRDGLVSSDTVIARYSEKLFREFELVKVEE